MDAYLNIARQILLEIRRPLGAKAILAAAYQRGFVPRHLFGKTQHKTLQARLSEDILERRDRSEFFRPEPGKFFLRQLLTDTSIPEEFRRPIATRRRARDLRRGNALAIDVNVLKRVARLDEAIEPSTLLNLLKYDCFRYDNPNDRDPRSVFLWSFVCIQRSDQTLTYRVGRYRENRDAFLCRRSIGFSTLVYQEECNLFNYQDCGIIDSGVRATKIDLDIPAVELSLNEERRRANLISFIWTSQTTNVSDLLAIVSFECPHWFEPVKRRLALNDLAWLDTRIPVNNIDDFDPWSRSVLLHVGKKR